MRKILRGAALCGSTALCLFAGHLPAAASLLVTPSGTENAACDERTPCSLEAAIHKALATPNGHGPWRIDIAPGHYNFDAPLVVPPGAGVPGSIHGAFSATKARGVTVGDGSAGNWLVTYTVDDASSVADGDQAIVRRAVGGGAFKVLEGTYRILGHTAKSITVRHTGQTKAFPAVTLSGADVTILHSVLNFPNTDGIDAHSSLAIDGVALHGGTAGAGVLTSHQGKAMDQHVAIAVGMNTSIIGFETGLNAQYGNTIDAGSSSGAGEAGAAVSDAATYGALAQHGGSLFFNGGIANGNRSTGVAATNNGDVSGTDSNESANGKFGTWTYIGGSFLGSNSWQWANGEDGDRASYGGVSRIGTHSAGSVEFNGATGLNAAGGGIIYAESDTIAHNRINNLQATDRGIVYAVGATAEGGGKHDVSVAHKGFVDISGGKAANLFAMAGGRINANKTRDAAVFSPALDEPLADGTLIYDNNVLATPSSGGGGLGRNPQIAGNDNAGRIVVGAAPGGVIFTIGFSHPKSHPPVCSAADETTRSANPIYPTKATRTGVTFVAAAPPSAGDAIGYSCQPF